MAILHRATVTASKGTSGFDITVTLPLTIEAGDLLEVSWDHANGAATISGDGTTAFTLVPNSLRAHSTANFQAGMWYRIANADDAGKTYTWTSTNSQRQALVISAHFDDAGGAWDPSPLDVSAIAEGAEDAGTHTLPTITTTGDNRLVVGAVGSNDSEAGDQSHTHDHLTERGDVSITSIIASLGDTVQASAGSTGTKTVTYVGTDTTVIGWLSTLAAFRLAAAGGADPPVVVGLHEIRDGIGPAAAAQLNGLLQ